MKKTFPVNINGKVFYIDEDAYSLLQDYLDQLNATFNGNEREEIVGDIEARISELFDERIALGATAIVYADVCRVIEIMGNPSEIGEQCDSDAEDTVGQQPSDKTASDNDKSAGTDTLSRRLYRTTSGKIFGGVVGGLATYLGWDANIMRILTVLLGVFTYVWPLVLIYLVAWMIIPPANTPRRVLEQKGTPVTVVNISQNVLSQQAMSPSDAVSCGNGSHNFFVEMIRGLGKICMAVIGFVGAAGAMIATGFALIMFVALLAFTCFHDVLLISSLGILPDLSGVLDTNIPIVVVSAFLCLSMCFIIPCLAVAWFSASYMFDFKEAAKTTVISALILETLIIVATIILFLYSDSMIITYK